MFHEYHKGIFSIRNFCRDCLKSSFRNNYKNLNSFFRFSRHFSKYFFSKTFINAFKDFFRNPFRDSSKDFYKKNHQRFLDVFFQKFPQEFLQESPRIFPGFPASIPRGYFGMDSNDNSSRIFFRNSCRASCKNFSFNNLSYHFSLYPSKSALGISSNTSCRNSYKDSFRNSPGIPPRTFQIFSPGMLTVIPAGIPPGTS